MNPRSTGTLIFTPEGGGKFHVEVDPNIVDYARALVPPALKVGLNRTRYAPHITLIRNEKWNHSDGEVSAWDGMKVGFTYDPRVVPGDVYWWLRVWSPGLTQVRRHFGLPASSVLTRPPDGEDCFHITIGNTKRGDR